MSAFSLPTSSAPPRLRAKRSASQAAGSGPQQGGRRSAGIGASVLVAQKPNLAWVDPSLAKHMVESERHLSGPEVERGAERYLVVVTGVIISAMLSRRATTQSPERREGRSLR